ncbi:MAG: hypothetical protein A2Y89_00415 [Chloroflexi bacterium RBG_13_51_18]|nr:MAG: hypothetical protein A2Y89_00415 [Chloroflexi bacterium RBG_13_51_18]
MDAPAVKSKVALVPCDTYDDIKVYDAVKQGIDLIGGLSQFVKAGEKIILKPNLLIGSAPEKCVCTHPAVFKAVGKILLEAGAQVSAGDSPGFGSTVLNMRLAGLKQAADELGIPVADFSKGTAVSHKEGLLVKRFVIADCVLAADGLVSLPKLKTHGLTRMTGAVKNQFGCVPGFLKGQQHARMPDPFAFATMLVDLNMVIKPRIYIMDAVMAMEGNGPRSGRPRKMGALLISSDPIALDAVACRIIDLNPSLVPTAEPGEKAGLGTYHEENIEVVGANVDDFICKDFDVIRKPVEHVSSGMIRNYFKNRINPRPVIDKALCTKCGTCVIHCPVDPKAVDWVNGDETRPPEHNYNRCIRCFCCQELCPEGAIFIKETLLGRLFFR